MAAKKKLVIGAVALGCALFAGAQMWGLYTQQPYKKLSSTGKASIAVEPTDPEDGSPCKVTLTVNGKVQWSKDLPYSITESYVTDDGHIFGIGKKRSKEGGYRGSEFVVVDIDPRGKILLEERTPITMSRYVDAGFDPLVEGVVFDADSDRAIVRVGDVNRNSSQETWHLFTISTGKHFAKVLPRLNGNNSVMDVRPIPGTNLLATSWYSYRDGSGSMGQSFAVMDYSGHALWSTDLPRDFNNGKENYEQFDLRTRAEEEGTILENSHDHQFSTWSVKDKIRFDYAVSGPENHPKITLLAKNPYDGKPKSGPKTLEVPVAEIPVESSFRIFEDKAAMTEVSNIDQFFFDANDHVVFLRSGDSPAIVEVDQAGKLVRKLTLPSPSLVGETERFLTKIKNGSYVLASSLLQDFGKTLKQAKTFAWRVDLGSGKFVPLSQFSACSIDAIAGLPDGRFAVLSTEEMMYTSARHVSLHSSSGAELWIIGESGYRGSEQDLLSPEDIAVDAKGRVVVLDNIRDSLQLFSSGGKLEKFLDLEKIWKVKPNYPTHITCCDNGQYWLNDFGNSSPCLRLDVNGKILQKFHPKMASGKLLEPRDKIVVDPKGNPWISETESIYRIGNDGNVAAVVGNQPRTAGLGEIRDVEIAQDGSVFAMDSHTGSVFHFDKTGKPLSEFKFGPNDVNDMMASNSMMVTRSGDLFVHTIKGTVRFTPTGQRLPIIPDSKQETVEGKPIEPQPTWRWYGPDLLDENNKVRMTLRRWKDGTWMLDGPSAMAPDGQLMAFSGSDYRDRKGTKPKFLGFFAANGTPQIQVPFVIPEEYLGAVAYDGTNAYFATKAGLVALDKSGKALWSFVPPGWKPDDIIKVEAVPGGLVLVGVNRFVIRIDPKRANVTSKLVKIEPEKRGY